MPPRAAEATPPHPARERPYQFMVVDMSRSMKPKDCREYVLELLKYRGDADTYKVTILLVGYMQLVL